MRVSWPVYVSAAFSTMYSSSAIQQLQSTTCDISLIVRTTWLRPAQRWKRHVQALDQKCYVSNILKWPLMIKSKITFPNNLSLHVIKDYNWDNMLNTVHALALFSGIYPCLIGLISTSKDPKTCIYQTGSNLAQPNNDCESPKREKCTVYIGSNWIYLMILSINVPMQLSSAWLLSLHSVSSYVICSNDH